MHREGGAAEGRGGGAHDRDADLNGGQELFGVLAQRRDGPGPAAPLLHQLGEARLPDGDDRDLGSREEAVREHQQENDENLGADTDLLASRREDREGLCGAGDQPGTLFRACAGEGGGNGRWTIQRNS